MKAAILNIDVNRATCDPSLYFEKGSFNYTGTQHLDQTAQKIADFVDDGRDYAHRILWTTQHINNHPGEEREYTLQEKQFHRVQPSHIDDDLLIKTQQSAYPEHTAVFDKLKESGVDTIIVTGFYADKCVRQSVIDLLDQKFKVIVPVDLTAESERSHLMNAFVCQDPMDDHSMFTRHTQNGQLVFTNAERTLEMLEHAEPNRKPPQPVAEYDGHMWSFSL